MRAQCLFLSIKWINTIQEGRVWSRRCSLHSLQYKQQSMKQTHAQLTPIIRDLETKLLIKIIGIRNCEWALIYKCVKCSVTATYETGGSNSNNYWFLLLYISIAIVAAQIVFASIASRRTARDSFFICTDTLVISIAHFKHMPVIFNLKTQTWENLERRIT